MVNNTHEPLARFVFTEIDQITHDEYEQEIVLKSYALAYRMTNFAVLLLMAVLAWALPGTLSLWSLAPVVVIRIPDLIATRWMRKRIPQPVVTRQPWPLILLGALTMVVTCAGIWFNTRDLPTLTPAAPTLFGGIAGMLTAIVFLPSILRRRNQRDEKRLNAELDD